MNESPGMIEGLDRSRHLDLEGRGSANAFRRLLLLVLLAGVVLALFNFFGQRSDTTTVTAPSASLEVLSPPRLRTGLLFQTRITVHAYTKIKQPTIVLDRGWFEAMTFNGAVPDATNWSSTSDGKVEAEYDKLAAGDTLEIWISWQANPPAGAHRTETLALRDGGKPIARIKKNLTVFP
jgi:hypothetical protein